MNAYPFGSLSRDAATHAVSLYWREILACPPDDFTATSCHDRTRVSWQDHAFSFWPLSLESLAHIALTFSPWLFTEHGERIA